jgi:hypothetical protein
VSVERGDHSAHASTETGYAMKHVGTRGLVNGDVCVGSGPAAPALTSSWRRSMPAGSPSPHPSSSATRRPGGSSCRPPCGSISRNRRSISSRRGTAAARRPARAHAVRASARRGFGMPHTHSSLNRCGDLPVEYTRTHVEPRPWFQVRLKCRRCLCAWSSFWTCTGTWACARRSQFTTDNFSRAQLPACGPSLWRVGTLAKACRARPFYHLRADGGWRTVKYLSVWVCCNKWRARRRCHNVRANISVVRHAIFLPVSWLAVLTS